MTKETLMKHFLFNKNEEVTEAEFYLKMKGISFHEQIAKYLGLDFKIKNEKIEWRKVSTLLRYDKRLRDKLYIYLATLEEYIRAFISNKYEDLPNQDFWINGKSRRAKIKTRINNHESVSKVLESIEFGILINQVLNLPPNDIDEMFDCIPNIKLNLDAVRELRNAVSHHVFLLDYKFKECIVDDRRASTLEHNIKNLRQLLPKAYQYGKNGKGGITAEIENCQYEFKFINGNRIKTKLMLNPQDVVHMT